MLNIRQASLAWMMLTLSACSGNDPPARVQAPISNIVAFMGDSITQYWAVSDYDTTNPTVNLGIAGQTTVQMLARFDAVLSSGAGVVVIEGGINDLYYLGPTVANTDSIAKMAAEAKAAGIRVIIASLLPDFYAYPAGVGYPPQSGDILAMNEALMKLCSDNGYLYADYYDEFLNADGTVNKSLYLDGLHPDADGYAVMWKVLQPLLNEELQTMP